MKMWNAGAAVEFDRNEVTVRVPVLTDRRWTIRSHVRSFLYLGTGRVWEVYEYGYRHLGWHYSWQAAMDYIEEES